MRHLSWLLMTYVSLGIVACHDNPTSPPADGDPNQAGDPLPPGDVHHGDPLPPADEAPVAKVDWAVLQFPDTASGSIGTSLDVYGRVYEPGLTPGTGRGTGITAEAGVGLVTTPPASWTWTAATYNTDTDSDANDEYMATLALPTSPGTYRYAFRFSLFGGPWVYADLSPGTTNGFDVLDAGTLTVTPAVTPAVDWCRLDGPPAMAVAPSATSSEVTASVYEPGITDGGTASALTGQVGVGPTDTTPNDSTWTWTAMVFEADDGNNDVHAGTFTAPAAEGGYDYAARFRLTAGGDWLLCDRDGSAVDGYTSAQAGKLTVTTVVNSLDWGVIRPATLLWEVVDTPPTVEVEIYEAGVTNADGQGSGVQVEVGVGPTASDPSVSTAGWQFAAATYNRDAHGSSNNDNDVYAYVMPTLVVGSYAYVARVSVDSGAHWTWVDADGDTSTFDSAKLGAADVVGRRVDWAKIMTPPDSPSIITNSHVAARVQVYEAGLTLGAGLGAGLEVQVGLGVDGWDPTTASDGSFAEAFYTGDADGEGGALLADDQFVGFMFPSFVPPGLYRVAARVRIGTGPWLYADTSGSSWQDPYVNTSGLGVTVWAFPPVNGAVEWCRLQSPTSEIVLAPGAATVVYGQVHATLDGSNVTGSVAGGFAGGPGPDSGIIIGPRGTVPPTGWTPLGTGAFNKTASTLDDEHLVRFVAPATTGDYDWAFAFTMWGGTTLYCDNDGSTPSDTYNPANAGKLKVQ